MYEHHRVFFSCYAIDTSAQDQLRDLVSTDNNSSNSSSSRVRLRDDSSRGIIADGACQILIRNAQSGLEALAT